MFFFRNSTAKVSGRFVTANQYESYLSTLPSFRSKKCSQWSVDLWLVINILRTVWSRPFKYARGSRAGGIESADVASNVGSKDHSRPRPRHLASITFARRLFSTCFEQHMAHTNHASIKQETHRLNQIITTVLCIPTGLYWNY